LSSENGLMNCLRTCKVDSNATSLNTFLICGVYSCRTDLLDLNHFFQVKIGCNDRRKFMLKDDGLFYKIDGQNRDKYLFFINVKS